jgi:signal transduction histidine kinase
MWATVIGAFSSLVLVPGPAGVGSVSWQWATAVAASQAAFALIIVGVRHASPDLGSVTVFLALAMAGAIRGFVLEVGAGLLGVSGISTSDVVSRTLNSAVISVIGVALIGATLAWRADFRAQYRLLRDRAILIGTAAHEGEDIEPSVLEAWTAMKRDLDTALQAANSRLADGATRRDMQEAAALLTDAIDVNLRPAARAMWQETLPADEPIRLGSLFVDTIERWRLPIWETLGFFLVVVGIGSVVRSGLVDGGAYTVRYLIVTGLILWASTSLARAMPRRAPVIAVVTLVLLPPVLLLMDYWIGQVLLGLPEDPAGQIIVALQTPITTVFIAMAFEAVREREQVLMALQARIDDEVALLRQQGGRSHRDAQRLSAFVHHSVQSELSAIAMQAAEAAATNDIATMEVVRHQTRARLDQLEALDAHSPPWARPERGRDRIDTVVRAWTGILEIEVDLPEESACRDDQWQLAARVIEEGLANSARHSDAGRVVLVARCESNCLVLRVSDDGSSSPHHSTPGMGAQWLDRVAPGEWSLRQTQQGAVLLVRIR